MNQSHRTTDEAFDTQLTRLIAAELYFLLGMNVARELYGKSYFALGVGEKQMLDQTVLAQVAGNFAAITPELLKGPRGPQAAGFQTHPAAPPSPDPTSPSADDPKA